MANIEYHDGFIKPKPRWLATWDAGKPRVLAFAVDTGFVAVLLLIATYFFTRVLSGGVGRFLVTPWWVLLIVIVELPVIWQAFGISVGMRAVGLRLVASDEEGSSPNLVARSIRVAMWHVSTASVIGVVWRLFSDSGSDPIDRVSHTRVVKISAEQAPKLPWYKASSGLATALLCVVILAAGVSITEINLRTLFTEASDSALVWKGLFSPDWSEFAEGLELLMVTIFMAFMATLFAVIIAAPLSFFAARNLFRGKLGRVVYTFLRVATSIIRSIEPIVWAIIFVVIVTPRRAAFAGVLALFLHSIADLTKLYSERLESIDPGPVEAITATGGSKSQVIQYGIVPQILTPYLSFTLYRWDINVRMATIIGALGGGGIGQMLIQYTRLWDWERAGMLILLIIATVWIMDYVSGRLRAHLE